MQFIEARANYVDVHGSFIGTMFVTMREEHKESVTMCHVVENFMDGVAHSARQSNGITQIATRRIS